MERWVIFAVMIAISLQSGSNGNCIYLESQGRGVLIDAGISGIQAERRLAHHGRDIRDVEAVIISHDHADHVRSAGIFNRKYGLPVYMTHHTFLSASTAGGLGRIGALHYFSAGDRLTFETLSLETVPTAHDGVDGAAFVATDGSCRLGVLTDLGHPFAGLVELVQSLDGVILESNYDPQMLERGPYPRFLKNRISGPGGHLSNDEAAAVLLRAKQGLRWACLAHLSEMNNTPDCALHTHRRILGGELPLHVASRYKVGAALEL